MSDIFKVHGWRKDKAIFEVELLLNSNLEREDIGGICSIFNTQPYNDNCSGCQFVLSFVLIVGDKVFYHPYLEDQDDYYVEMGFHRCTEKFYENDLLKHFEQESWN